MCDLIPYASKSFENCCELTFIQAEEREIGCSFRAEVWQLLRVSAQPGGEQAVDEVLDAGRCFQDNEIGLFNFPKGGVKLPRILVIEMRSGFH